MAEACGIEGLALIGLIVGSVIASIGYSFYKGDRLEFEKEIAAK